MHPNSSTGRCAIILLSFTSHCTLQFRRFYANASRHASSSLLIACSRRRVRPNIPSQTTFIRVAKFEVDGVFFRLFRPPSFTHFHPSKAPYAFPSIKTPCACNYQSILSNVFSQLCLSECFPSIFNHPCTGVTALNVCRLHISLVFYPSNKTAKHTSIYTSI